MRTHFISTVAIYSKHQFYLWLFWISSPGDQSESQRDLLLMIFVGWNCWVWRLRLYGWVAGRLKKLMIHKWQSWDKHATPSWRWFFRGLGSDITWSFFVTQKSKAFWQTSRVHILPQWIQQLKMSHSSIVKLGNTRKEKRRCDNSLKKKILTKKRCTQCEPGRPPKVTNSLNTTNLEVRTNKTQKQGQHLQRTKKMTPIVI